MWRAPSKTHQKENTILVSHIVGISAGAIGKFVTRKGKPLHERRCFSITLENKSLDFEAPTSKDRAKWLFTLQLLVGGLIKNFEEEKEIREEEEVIQDMDIRRSRIASVFDTDVVREDWEVIDADGNVIRSPLSPSSPSTPSTPASPRSSPQPPQQQQRRTVKEIFEPSTPPQPQAAKIAQASSRSPQSTNLLSPPASAAVAATPSPTSRASFSSKPLPSPSPSSTPSPVPAVTTAAVTSTPAVAPVAPARKSFSSKPLPPLSTPQTTQEPVKAAAAVPKAATTTAQVTTSVAPSASTRSAVLGQIKDTRPLSNITEDSAPGVRKSEVFVPKEPEWKAGSPLAGENNLFVGLERSDKGLVHVGFYPLTRQP